MVPTPRVLAIIPAPPPAATIVRDPSSVKVDLRQHVTFDDDDEEDDDDGAESRPSIIILPFSRAECAANDTDDDSSIISRR